MPRLHCVLLGDRSGSTGCRRRGSVRLLLVTAVAAAGVTAGLSPAARGQCLPPVTSCPPPPPRSHAPRARITGVTDIRDRRATFTAEINTGGLATTYDWGYEYSTGYGTYEAPRHEYKLPASSGWVRIRTTVRVHPGSRYDSLTLNVSNQDGSIQADWPGAFTTPEHPRPRLMLRRDWLTFGKPFPVKVRVFGTYNSLQAVRFHVAKPPSWRWRVADGDSARRYRANSVTTQPCFSGQNYQCAGLDRNFKLRATLGPGRSQTRLIYVLPYLVLTAQRENYGSSPWIDVTYSALVHRMRRYPHQLAYFYMSSSRHGRFTRVGAARFRVAVRSGVYGTQLHAKVRIYDRHPVYFRACFRHRLVADMGPRFTARGCGQRSIN